MIRKIKKIKSMVNKLLRFGGMMILAAVISNDREILDTVLDRARLTFNELNQTVSNVIGEKISLDNVPDYSGFPYVQINGNVPFFLKTTKTVKAHLKSTVIWMNWDDAEPHTQISAWKLCRQKKEVILVL